MSSISVIVPAYNAEKYIAEALESILSQSLRPTEVIVVNDGSTDQTAEVLNSMTGIKVVHQPNRGISYALNTGLALATSDFIAFLDADDVWLPNKLSIQMAELRLMNYSGIVFGQMEQFFSPDIDQAVKATLELPKQQLAGIHRSAMLIDRTSLERVSEFSTDHISAEFLDWYLRAKEMEIPVRLVDQPVARRRIHGSNTTLSRGQKHFSEFPLIIKQALDRRRAGK